MRRGTRGELPRDREQLLAADGGGVAAAAGSHREVGTTVSLTLTLTLTLTLVGGRGRSPSPGLQWTDVQRFSILALALIRTPNPRLILALTLTPGTACRRFSTEPPTRACLAKHCSPAG